MKILNLILAVSLVGACTKIEEQAEILIQNDEAELSARVTANNQSISVSDTTTSTKVRARAVNSAEFALTLVADVAAPVHEGTVLQATEVRIKGNKAYVSYNVKGEAYLGAVDIFDISHPSAPTLISNAIFTNRDINGLTISGDKLYLAAATSDEAYTTPAILDVISLQGGLLTDTRETVDIASYAATDVDTHGEYIYVTSGASGGKVTLLNKSTLEALSILDVEDARGVDVNGNDVSIVAGTNARLINFDATTATTVSDYNLVGATIANSKSTVEIKQGMAFLGLGDGGMQVICLADGSVVSQVDQPIVDGLDNSLTVTNAVTAHKRSVFMSNGEAGVYLALASSNLNSNSCSVDNLVLAGKLQMDVQQSVNHVTYRADNLFVAAGSGGLKVLSVDDSVATEDLDDAE